MHRLDPRISRLEDSAPGGKPVYLWREFGETTERAINRHFGGPASDDAVVYVLSWRTPRGCDGKHSLPA